MNYFGFTKRNIAVSVLLTFVTCGIYTYYLLYKQAEEVSNALAKANIEGKRFNPAMVVFLSIITCGIYFIFFMYCHAENINLLGKSSSVNTFEPIVILLLTLFVGFGLYFTQYDLNKLYDKTISYQPTF